MRTWPYVLTCIVCWALWGVIQKVAVRDSSPMMVQLITAYVYSAVAPMMFLYMKATGKATTWSAHAIAWTTVSCALIIAGALAYSTAIQRASVNSVVGWTSTYPALAVFLCWALLGEPVTSKKVVGIAVVVFGLFILG